MKVISVHRYRLVFILVTKSRTWAQQVWWIIVLRLRSIISAMLSNEKVCSNTSYNTTNQNSTDNLSPMGRLKDRYDEWEKVTSNPFILGVIRDGYKLPFKEVPEQSELKNKSARDNTQFVKEEVQKLLAKGCVEKVEERPSVVNPLTVATNKSG